MAEQSVYTLTISDTFSEEELNKNAWLIILHASRIPPHIGVLMGGNYNSLTIKGHELNVNSSTLLKLIQQKKIEVLFIQLKKHPVFSLDYQKEICQYYIQQYSKVTPNEASCLSPIKFFLQEFYAIAEQKNELLFELIERLKQNNYITKILGLNITDKLIDGEYALPIYTQVQLSDAIQLEIDKLAGFI